ncbi:MAG: glycosyltransferase family 4 protein [Thermoguttaceae bacterium]|jgi:glycosyltransferase involved in cell wall biosynthesis
MDILYASTLYPPAIGGSQIHLHCLVARLQAMGHRVQVVTHTSRYRTDWLRLSTFACERRRNYQYEGVPVAQLGLSAAGRLRAFPWAMCYYLLMGPAVRHLSALIGEQLAAIEAAPALVHVTRNGREFLAQAALDYARRRRIPLVLTPNHHPRWRGPLYRQYDRIYRAADALIVLTAAEKELLAAQKGIAPERIHVTGIGPVLAAEFSAEAFRRRYGVPGRFVLYLGQQFRYKGVGAVVAAAEAVWRRHPDVQFVFAGPHSAYSRRLFARRRDPRLVNLAGIDLETKTAALAACELLCLPSQQESFGGVYVEAWSQRKPVIGGRIPPIAAVIDDGRDGLLSSQSPDELAAALCRLLADPAQCAAMGQAGWEKVQRQYTWPVLAQKTLAVYQSCC